MSQLESPTQSFIFQPKLFVFGVLRCIVKVRNLILITTGFIALPGRSISRIL